MKHLLAFLLLAIIVVACGTQQRSSVEETSEEVTSYKPGTRTLRRSVEDITTLSTRAEYEDMIARYWDDFDFECGERIVEYDTIDIIYAMSDYVALIPRDKADTLLTSLMRRASTSRPVLDFFSMITETVLHDPNSPMRNDEYYIPILEVLVESPLLNEYERLIPAYDLDMISKNRIGTTATDFSYTLSDGRTGTLHDIKATYTILMFINPDCPMCAEICDKIVASPLINELSEMGHIKTLTVYPDADLEAWRNHLAHMPRKWINAYDKGMVITEERLYNLNAIPSLYLLDKDKRVIIKDGVSVEQIEDVIAILEAQ